MGAHAIACNGQLTPSQGIQQGMPTLDPEASASARRAAPWWLVLLVVGAIILSAAVMLANWLLAFLGVAVLAGAALLLGWTSLRGGRGDEPSMQSRV